MIYVHVLSCDCFVGFLAGAAVPFFLTAFGGGGFSIFGGGLSIFEAVDGAGVP